MTMLPFILFTVFTNAAAQIMLKQGMLTLGPLETGGPTGVWSLVLLVLKVVFHPWVFLGLVTFVVSMASHLFVLSKVELSFAYPFLSLAYVAVALASWWLFTEDLNAWRVGGIALICLGTVAIAQGGEGQTQQHDGFDRRTRGADMRHIIYGGDGFVGRHLAARLVDDGEEVVVADIQRSPLPHYARCRFVHLDVTEPQAFERLPHEPTDVTYNLSAKMLSPLAGARQAPRLLLAGELPRHREHPGLDEEGRRLAPRPLHHRHGLRPH